MAQPCSWWVTITMRKSFPESHTFIEPFGLDTRIDSIMGASKKMMLFMIGKAARLVINPNILNFVKNLIKS